jgi:hypothetical protein
VKGNVTVFDVPAEIDVDADVSKPMVPAGFADSTGGVTIWLSDSDKESLTLVVLCLVADMVSDNDRESERELDTDFVVAIVSVIDNESEILILLNAIETAESAQSTLEPNVQVIAVDVLVEFSALEAAAILLAVP